MKDIVARYQPHLQRDRFVCERHRGWRYRHLLFCEQHLDYRRQNKTGTEITGYDFVIKVEKSRMTKEQSKILSLCHGKAASTRCLACSMWLWQVVLCSSFEWLVLKEGEEKKYREKELDEVFWQKPILADTEFQSYVENALYW